MVFYSQLIPLLFLTAAIGAAAAVLVMKIFVIGKGSSEGKEKVSKDAIVIGIKEHATDFASLYEYTYALSCGDTKKAKNVFEQWNTTIREGEYEDAFKTAFEDKYGKADKWKKKKKFKKAAKKLVKQIFKAGVIRSNEEIAVADELTAERYDMPGETSIEAEQEYEVLAPYWYNKNENDMVLVKGVIR